MDKLASSPTPPLTVMPSHMVMDVKGSASDVRPGETNYSEDELDHHRSHYTSDSETMSDSESSMASLTDHGRRCLDSADSIDKKVRISTIDSSYNILYILTIFSILVLLFLVLHLN
nr:unnamed protein product [Callosobruchus analis]